MMGDSQGEESRFSPLSAVARTWFALAFQTGNTTGLSMVFCIFNTDKNLDNKNRKNIQSFLYLLRLS